MRQKAKILKKKKPLGNVFYMAAHKPVAQRFYSESQMKHNRKIEQVVSGWKWLGPSCECCRKLRLLVVTHGKDVGDPVLEQRHDCRCFTYRWENREGDSQVKSGHTEEYFVCSQKVRLHFLRESSQKKITQTHKTKGDQSAQRHRWEKLQDAQRKSALKQLLHSIDYLLQGGSEWQSERLRWTQWKISSASVDQN